MDDYDEVLDRNVRAYDGAVAERAATDIAPWKLTEHDAFAARLVEAGLRSVVEIGAGTGFHSRRFADAGFDVLATDPSPAMVAHCASLGLATRRTDVLGLALVDPVDAAFAMNSLLHVPRALLATAFDRIRALVAPGGLAYVGIYGGNAEEGFRDQDHYEPKRFFASHTDDELVVTASSVFTVVDFHTVDLGSDDLHFQSLTMQRPASRDGHHRR